MIPILGTRHRPWRKIIVPSAWTPASESGLLGWWNVKTLAGLSEDDSVGTLGDASGNGRDLTEATNRPVYKGTLINGNPAILFDGVNDRMQTTTFTANQPTMIIGVIYQPTIVANGTIFDGAGGLNTRRVYNPNTTAQLNLYAGGFGPAAATPSAGTAFIVRAVFNGASSKLQIDSGSAATGNAGTNNASGMKIGAAGNNSAFTNTAYGEFFLYDHELDATAQTNAMNYLTTGWGL